MSLAGIPKELNFARIGRHQGDSRYIAGEAFSEGLGVDFSAANKRRIGGVDEQQVWPRIQFRVTMGRKTFDSWATRSLTGTLALPLIMVPPLTQVAVKAILPRS